MNHFLNKLFFIINLLNNLLQLRNLVNQIMIKILYKSFLLLSLILYSFSIHSQMLSEKEFEQRLNYERGNYAIQNYNQSFLDRPGFVWGILKSKKDNIIYMASNGGVLEYDGISVRRIPLKEDTTYNSNFIGLARTVVETDEGEIYVTGNNRFGRLVKNNSGFNEFEYLLHKLPDSVDYRRQVIWGSLELDGKIYMNTPNFIFRWDGNKFDKICLCSAGVFIFSGFPLILATCSHPSNSFLYPIALKSPKRLGSLAIACL